MLTLDVWYDMEVYACIASFPDSVVWECHLAGRIVPGRSKLSLGKVRWEVKLHKADPIQWSDYEVSRVSYSMSVGGGKSATLNLGMRLALVFT